MFAGLFWATDTGKGVVSLTSTQTPQQGFHKKKEEKKEKAPLPLVADLCCSDMSPLSFTCEWNLYDLSAGFNLSGERSAMPVFQNACGDEWFVLVCVPSNMLWPLQMFFKENWGIQEVVAKYLKVFTSICFIRHAHHRVVHGCCTEICRLMSACCRCGSVEFIYRYGKTSKVGNTCLCSCCVGPLL